MRRAFSILEIIIGVALVVVISAAGFLVLGRTRSGAALDSTASQIVALLREGQQNALSSVSGTAWGVRFDNATSTGPSISLFSSSTFSAGAVVRTVPLPGRVAYDSGVLAAGGTLDIIFAQGTGRAAASSTITIRTTDSERAYRIDVSEAGLVESTLTTSTGEEGGEEEGGSLTVTGITPSSGPNSGSLSVTSIAGTGFVEGASVRLTRAGQPDIPGELFTVANATTLAGGSFDLTGAEGGTWTVVVSIPLGRGSNNASCVACLTVTVPGPAPTVSGISASSGAQGAGQPFTVTGTGFVTGASVAVSGAGVGVSGTSVTSATSITGTLSMDAAAPTGARTVTVTNPDAQQGACAGCLTVTAGPPVPTSAAPPDRGQGAANQSVTVTGTRFVSGAAATVSGLGVTVNGTTYVSPTTLTLDVTVSGVAATGARNVTVVNPDAQQGTCTGCFTVNAKPAPASASPASLAQGATGQDVTITGTGFVSGAAAAFSGTGITVNGTTYVSATSLTANVTVSGGATLGARTITVTNPDGGVGTGGTFTVDSPPAVSYYRTITIDRTKVPNTTQANFPVLVSGTYPYLRTVANGGRVENANGYDVRFFSDVGLTTQLKHETERYVAATGEVIYWVKVPSLSHTTDTVIYMAYGDADITTDQSDRANVWDSNFRGVWHLPNGSALTAVNSVTGSSDGIGTVTATTGKIDGGALFEDTETDNVTTGLTSTSTLATYSIWSYRSGEGGGGLGRLFQKGPSGSTVRLLNDTGSNYGINVGWSTLGTWAFPEPTANAWHHVAFTYDGGSASNDPVVYVNGSPVALTVDTNPTGTRGFDAQPYVIGGSASNANREWLGSLDEFRVSHSIRSADWIKAEYNNQSSPSTFYAVGAENTAP